MATSVRVVCDVRVKSVRWAKQHHDPGGRRPNVDTCMVSLVIVGEASQLDDTLEGEKRGASTLADADIRVIDDDDVQKPYTGAVVCDLPAVSPLIIYSVELKVCANHRAPSNPKNTGACTCLFHKLHAVVFVQPPTAKWLRECLSAAKVKGITKLMKRIRKTIPARAKKRKRKRCTRETLTAKTAKKKKRRKINSAMIMTLYEEDEEEEEEEACSTTETKMVLNEAEDPDAGDEAFRVWWQTHDWDAYGVPLLLELLDGACLSVQQLTFLQGVCRLDRHKLLGSENGLAVCMNSLSMRETPATLAQLDADSEDAVWAPCGWTLVYSGGRGCKQKREDGLKARLGRWRWSAAGPVKDKRCSQTGLLLTDGTLFADSESGVAFWSQWQPQFERVRAFWCDKCNFPNGADLYHGVFEEHVGEAAVGNASTASVAVYCQSFARAHYIYETGHTTGVVATYVCTLANVKIADGNADTRVSNVYFDHVEDWTLAQGYHALQHATQRPREQAMQIPTVTVLCDPALVQHAHTWLEWQNDASPRLFWLCIGGAKLKRKSTSRPSHILPILDELNKMIVRLGPLSIRPLVQSPWCVGKGFRFYRFPTAGMKAPLWKQFSDKAKRMDLRSVLFVCGSIRSCRLIAEAAQIPGRCNDKNAPGNLVMDTRQGLVSVLSSVDASRNRKDPCYILHPSPKKVYYARHRDAILQMNGVMTCSRLAGMQFSFDQILVVFVLTTSASDTKRPEVSARQFRRVLMRCTAVNHDNLVIISTRTSLEAVLASKQQT